MKTLLDILLVSALALSWAVILGYLTGWKIERIPDKYGRCPSCRYPLTNQECHRRRFTKDGWVDDIFCYDGKIYCDECRRQWRCGC